MADLFPPEKTVAQARDEFWEGIKTKHGHDCAVCDRNGKMYARQFNRGMARNLIWLYQHRPDFKHLSKEAPRHILNDNQVSKLEFWGFAERLPNKDNPKKNQSGWWRITSPGIAFIEGRITANSHVIEFNKHVFGWRDKQITMSHALGKHFDYRELMEESPP